MHQWNSGQTSEKHLQMCSVSTVSLEKSDLNQFTFINTKGGIRGLLHPVPHDDSGTNTGGAHKLKIVNDLWPHAMSGLKEQGDLFWMLTHQETQSGNFDNIFKFVVVKSFTADSNLLQPTGGWTKHPHTSHFLALACAHFNVARDIGSRCLARITSCHHAFICAFDLILFDPLFCTLHCLSHLPFHSPVLHLQLPCGLLRWEVSCVLPRMRS